MARSPQLARLTRKLERIPQSVREAVAPALQKSGDEIAGHMRHLAPKDTGALEASIAVTPGGSSTPAYSQPGGATLVPIGAVAITAGNVDVRYAHLAEYGHANAAPRPFFWPSYRLLKRKTGTRIKRALSKAVRQGWAS